MSTSVLMNSVIEKLTQRPEKTTQLIFNSDNALKKQKELKTRVTSLYIDESSFITLAAFFQNIDISIFTDEELRFLLSFNYSTITAIKILPNEALTNLKVPYYDLNNTIINMPFNLLNNLGKDFKKLHSINKSLSLEYLISYLISQI